MPKTITAEGPISCVMISSNPADPILKKHNLLHSNSLLRSHLEQSKELRIHLIKLRCRGIFFFTARASAK